MKNLTLKNRLICLIFTFFFIFTSMTLVKAQYYSISMEEKLEHSSLIIEGKVVNKEAFRHDNHIYTKNQIKVIRTVKGDVIQGEFVEVITSGGMMDDVTETWTHMPELTLNQHSFFFLRPASQSMYSGLNRSNAYEIYSGVQGIYSFSKDVSRTIYSTLESYRDVEHFYQKIGIPEYAEYTSPEEMISERSSPGDTCIVYNLRPVGNTFSDTTAIGERVINIQLDLFIKVTAGSFRLYNANLETYYNTTMFGSNVVANGKISAVKSAAFNSNYSLTLTDEASDKIKINLLGTTINAASLQQIDTGYKHVARFTLEIIGWDGNSPLEWDELTIDNDKYSEEGTNVIRNFGCKRFKFGTCVDPNITNDTEMDDFDYAAGIGDQSAQSSDNILGKVTIKGSKFGISDGIHPPEGRRVEFPTEYIEIEKEYISPVNEEYLKWTDSEIIVRIPSTGHTNHGTALTNSATAVTGRLRVCVDDGLKKCNCSDRSSKNIDIQFSVRNNFSTSQDKLYRHYPLNLDGQGGYSYYFENDLNLVSFALDNFKEAMKIWRCTHGFNIKLGVNNYDPDDVGHVLVKFGQIPAGNTSSTIAVTNNSSFTLCNPPDIRVGGMIRISMIFKNDANLWTTITSPGSNMANFKSTALHEIGHALGFNHTIDDDDVMYKEQLGFNATLALSENDIKATNHLKSLVNNCSILNSMIFVPEEGCTLSNKQLNNSKKFISQIGTQRINLSNIDDMMFMEVTILDLLGRSVGHISKLNLQYQNFELNIGHLTPGVYFVVLDNNKIISKFIKL